MQSYGTLKFYYTLIVLINYPLTSPVILEEIFTKQITTYIDVILSRNKCRKIGSKAFRKKEGRVRFRL